MRGNVLVIDRPLQQFGANGTPGSPPAPRKKRLRLSVFGAAVNPVHNDPGNQPQTDENRRKNIDTADIEKDRPDPQLLCGISCESSKNLAYFLDIFGEGTALIAARAFVEF